MAKGSDTGEQASDLLTVQEVACLLRMDDTTIRKLIQDGKMDAIRLPSGGIRIRKATVDAIRKQKPKK